MGWGMSMVCFEEQIFVDLGDCKRLQGGGEPEAARQGEGESASAVVSIVAG